MIKKDRMLYEYLKYHSYWYKEIKDNKDRVKEMILEMKKELKMTSEDKLINLSKKIEMMKAFLEVIS